MTFPGAPRCAEAEHTVSAFSEYRGSPPGHPEGEDRGGRGSGQRSPLRGGGGGRGLYPPPSAVASLGAQARGRMDPPPWPWYDSLALKRNLGAVRGRCWGEVHHLLHSYDLRHDFLNDLRNTRTINAWATRAQDASTSSRAVEHTTTGSSFSLSLSLSFSLALSLSLSPLSLSLSLSLSLPPPARPLSLPLSLYGPSSLSLPPCPPPAPLSPSQTHTPSLSLPLLHSCGLRWRCIVQWACALPAYHALVTTRLRLTPPPKTTDPGETPN